MSPFKLSLSSAALLVSQIVSAQQALPLYPGEIPHALQAADEESLRDPN